MSSRVILRNRIVVSLQSHLMKKNDVEIDLIFKSVAKYLLTFLKSKISFEKAK